MYRRLLWFVLLPIIIVFIFFNPAAWLRKTFLDTLNPSSVYEFSPSEAEDQLAKAEASLPAIGKLIAHDRFLEAGELCDKSFYPLRRALREGHDITLKHQRTLSGELDRLEKVIGKQAWDRLTLLLQPAAQGEPDTSRLHLLASTFPALGGYKVEEEYHSQYSAMDPFRRPFATHWVRLNFWAPDQETRDCVERLLKDKIDLPTGYAFAFGPPAGPAEKAATFCALEVKITYDIQRYVISSKTKPSQPNPDKYYSISGDGLLTGLRIEMEIAKSTSAGPTSWDKLPGMSSNHFTLGAYSPAPEHIEFPTSAKHGEQEEFRDRNIERKNELLEKLNKTFADLPALTVRPKGIISEGFTRPAQPNKVSNDKPSPQEAPTVRSLPAPKPAEGACAIVEAGREDLAPVIENKLPAMSSPERDALAKTLARHPQYNAYRTLMLLVSGCPTENLNAAIVATTQSLNNQDLAICAWRRVFQEKSIEAQREPLRLLTANSPESFFPVIQELCTAFPKESQTIILETMLRRDKKEGDALAQLMLNAPSAQR